VAGLDHLSQKFVDLVLPVAEVTTFNEVVGLLPPAARRRIQLERPQEVASILEVLANSHDLVNDVLNADHAVLAKDILNDIIGRNGDTPTLNLGIASLIDKLPHRLEVRGSPGNEGL